MKIMFRDAEAEAAAAAAVNFGWARSGKKRWKDIRVN